MTYHGMWLILLALALAVIAGLFVEEWYPWLAEND